MILIDTDVMIDILRDFPPARAWLQSLADREVALPGFVVMELLQGCRNKGELNRLKKFLDPFLIIWPSPESCDRALEAFSKFYLHCGLGMIDSLIGQCAADKDSTLYSFNKKHYEVIPGIDVRIPYKRKP